MFEISTKHNRTRRVIELSLERLVERNSLASEMPQTERALEHYSFPTTAEAQALLCRVQSAGQSKILKLSGREMLVLRDASVRLQDSFNLERSCGGDKQPAFLRNALPKLVGVLQTQIDSAIR